MANDFIGEVIGYGYDGEGVCRVDGKVVFVPYALRGEKILLKIEDSRSSFCRGKVIEIKEKSPIRQNAPCPYFERCGGCVYQHTTYQNELEIKKDSLSSQLNKIGINNEIEVIPSPFEYGYRNKIRMFVGENGLSLKERASSNLCPIDNCMLVSKEMNRAIEIVNSFISAQKLKNFYKEVVIREEGNNLIVDFIVSKKKSKVNYQGLYLRLGRNYGIFENSIHKLGLHGLNSNEFGLKCSFKPNTFHQVNKYLTDILYKSAIEWVAGKSVVNCYSGAGVLSGAISQSGKRVIGIELGQSEHNDAEELKEENGLFYLTNMHGDCAEILPKLNEKIDTVIVDPPRSGMDKSVVETLNKLTFDRLIYISCNSATLVRDLGRLNGFSVKKVLLFDMFARTGEYETLVILEKSKI